MLHALAKSLPSSGTQFPYFLTSGQWTFAFEHNAQQMLSDSLNNHLLPLQESDWGGWQPGCKEVQPPYLPPTLTSQLGPAYHKSLPFPNCPQPLVLLSKTRLPGATQGWSREVEPEGAGEDSLRASRASAASSFRCHSEEAETEAWLEASGAWKQRMWENGSWEPTLPPCPFSPRLPWGLLLFSFTKLGPCQGSGPHNLPRVCGCSRMGLRVAWGWRIRVECLGTRKGEIRRFIPLAGTYYQGRGGARSYNICMWEAEWPLGVVD